jgi:hypothetical protein
MLKEFSEHIYWGEPCSGVKYPFKRMNSYLSCSNCSLLEVEEVRVPSLGPDIYVYVAKARDRDIFGRVSL